MQISFTPKILAASLMVAALAGCSAMPQDKPGFSYETASENVPSDWDAEPPVVERPMIVINKSSGQKQLPKEFGKKNIDLKLDRWVTGEEIVSILRYSNIPVVMSNEKMSEIKVYLPTYKGDVTGFITLLSEVTEMSFVWRTSTLHIDQFQHYMIKVPQNEDVISSVTAVMGSLGAEDVTDSGLVGLISYRATSQTQDRIDEYINEMALNTAMVSLQVAVINVKLDEQRRTGFDWSSLALNAGKLGMLTTGTDEVVKELSSGIVGQLTSGGLSFSGQTSNVTLDGVLNLLSTYGDSKMIQNLSLKTLSGVEVSLRSGESIPYVEDVSLNVNDSGSSTSGASTATVDTGFDIKLLPAYEHESQLVTIDMALTMKSLVGFTELSAGNQLGALTRPQLQDQDISNIVRLPAGETALVGGLIYESTSDNRSSMAGLESANAGSKYIRKSKNALFVLMRPTVTVYSKKLN